MSTPVGITVPKLLPITGTFIPAFSLYYIVLSARVSLERMQHEVFLDNNKSADPASPSTDTTTPTSLTVSRRSHANFGEYVPFALLTAAVVELNGGNRRVLTGALSALLAFRIMHVELGMKGAKALGWGRSTGHSGTMAFLMGMTGYAAYLVKGYWGF